MLRISGFKFECHGIRFGTLNAGNLCGRKTEVCEELKKVDGYWMPEVRRKAQELVLWVLRDEGINCSDQEMTKELDGLES